MENQKQIIRKYLEKKGSITGAIAFTELGVYRLSDVIMKLRRSGMDIPDCVIKTNPNTGKKYGEYSYIKSE